MLLAVALLVLAGCTTEVDRAPTPTAPTPSHVALPRVSADTDAFLVQTRVTRDGDRLDVSALWGLVNGNRNRRELVAGTGARLVRTAKPSDGEVRNAFPRPNPTTRIETASLLGRLLQLQVPSLDGATRVVIGGGDGATLLPFERVARSEEYGDWTVQPLPLFSGERAYVSGAVTLSDGRLVALLDHFSDDRGGHPANRNHGLWVSDGEDLSSYAPMVPRFVPALTQNPDGWSAVVTLDATTAPDPVVWVTTWDQRLYVSRDGMRTFREVAAR